MTSAILHLASSSSRRAELLRALGISFTARGVNIDETPLVGEAIDNMVLRLAEAKARAAANVCLTPVLGSDTAVALEGNILGKPASMHDALHMLSRLSGRCHQVLTAVVLIAGDRVLRDLSVTSVRFREIPPDEARQYWDSGESAGKAGGYAIQGIGGVFVESISGSYTGVVGLPVFQTARLLQRAGIPILPALICEGI